MIYDRDDIEGVDAALLTQKHVLKNSGHEDTFSDPMTDCKVCKKRFRTDHLESDQCQVVEHVNSLTRVSSTQC